MSQLSKSTYKALYGSTGTTFPDNTTEEISEGDMRQFGEDQADSFMSINDNFIDEDSFVTDSATKAPSQQSTKAYVDAQVNANLSGLAWKAPVKARTTAALAANTVGGGNTTLTADANGAFPSQDGVTINLNDAVLVANESTGSKNGIYTLTQVGSAGTPWILTRRSDNDSTAEMQNAVVSIDQGTSNADTSWRQSADSVTIGSTSVAWVSFGAGVTTASETNEGIAEIATQAEVINGTDDQKIVTPSKLRNSIFNTDFRFFEQDDFINQYLNSLESNWVYSIGLVGTNATDGVNNTENAFGVLSIHTGTTTTGNGTIVKANLTNAYIIGNGASLRLRFRVLINTLSDGTETFTVRIGFIDLLTGNGTDGLFYRYTDSVNGGRWEAVARSGGSETADDTGVAPTAGVYQILEVSVNSTGTQCDFYIDDVLTASITTNIPTGSSNLTNIMAKIEKSAGTTLRYIALDWYDFLLTRTTPR
jgi:hypothetical protein